VEEGQEVEHNEVIEKVILKKKIKRKENPWLTYY